MAVTWCKQLIREVLNGNNVWMGETQKATFDQKVDLSLKRVNFICLFTVIGETLLLLSFNIGWEEEKKFPLLWKVLYCKSSKKQCIHSYLISVFAKWNTYPLYIMLEWLSTRYLQKVPYGPKYWKGIDSGANTIHWNKQGSSSLTRYGYCLLFWRNILKFKLKFHRTHNATIICFHTVLSW